MLDSSGPGDHGKAASKSVQQKWVRVCSLSLVDSDDSNPDLTTSETSFGDNLNETDQSQPTPCNSQESSPTVANMQQHNNSMVELEASQDELDELDCDESTEQSMETSQESHNLKRQLHEKQKQVKKAEKQARIQHLCSQLAETDHKLDLLLQKTLAQPASGRSSSQPMATSTPQLAA